MEKSDNKRQVSGWMYFQRLLLLVRRAYQITHKKGVLTSIKFSVQITVSYFYNFAKMFLPSPVSSHPKNIIHFDFHDKNLFVSIYICMGCYSGFSTFKVSVFDNDSGDHIDVQTYIIKILDDM